jgi:hypothetical protein
LRIGDKFIDEIDTAIRIREKVVLVLSENSIKSVWVEDEVTSASAERPCSSDPPRRRRSSR